MELDLHWSTTAKRAYGREFSAVPATRRPTTVAFIFHAVKRRLYKSPTDGREESGPEKAALSTNKPEKARAKPEIAPANYNVKEPVAFLRRLS